MSFASRAARSLPVCIAFAACSGDPSGTEATASASDSGISTSTTGTLEPTGTPEPTTGPSGPTTGPEPTTGGPTSTTDAPESTTGGGDDGGLSQRPADPIVLVGGQVPGLQTVAAADIVGFAWRDGEWTQIPIQVDERVRIDFCTIYARALLGEAGAPCKTTKIIDALFYADPNTYTGPDSDPAFDLDDELVFMARDAGGRAQPGAVPASVVAETGVEVELLDGRETGWVYLFERTGGGGLSPDAGADLISYTLTFEGDIDYMTEYPFVGLGSCGGGVCDPPILEDSLVSSPHYERHFSARWVTDSLRITSPGSTGTDLLDITQARFGPDNCGRHVLTFSTAEGAFIANIDGPVRAIRSYLGANSGPLTQRTHLFYDRLEVVQTFLRVHPIGGIMELIDYAGDAPGMTYYNEHNESGLPIDGVPDPDFDPTQFAWELISGPHGSIVSLLEPRYSQPLVTVGYHEDDAQTANNQCSASNVLDHPDDQAFGTSGMWIAGAIPGTDPRNGDLDYLFIERTQYYEVPDLDLDAAKQLVGRAQHPPQPLARGLGGAPGEACGDAVCSPGEACPYDCNPFDQTCGDGLCDPWENSINCAPDCSTGAMGSGCGDQTCDPGEHQLSCAPDCWLPAFVPLVNCLGQSCAIQHGACNDELPCVDRVVCTAQCVAGGGALATCQNTCAMQVPATPEQSALADALLACAHQSCV